jgi:hypothetical protein
MRGLHRPIFVMAAMLVAGRADARQYSAERGQVSAAGEARILSFDRLQGVKRLRQFTAPVGLIAPLGRFTFDLGTSWASTQLLRPDGTRQTVSHITDTQARGSYVFGRDAVVATVLLNLPTGPSQASVRDYTVIGASRLSLGVTYSTFGDDQFGVSGGTGRGQYRPGPRWLIEAGLVAPVGNTTLGVYAWNFHRTAGDTTGSSAGNRENLAVGEITLSVPVAGWLAIEPMAMGRVSTPESGHGKMGGVGATLRFRLNDAVSLTPTARYDAGSVTGANGAKTSLHGGYLSAFLRASF